MAKLHDAKRWPVTCGVGYVGTSAQVGNEEYAGAFCRGYSSTKRFVMSRGASPDIAEEIAQAAWVTGWEHRGELRNPALICIWVNSIAKNMLLQHFEKTRRMDQLSIDSPVSPRDCSFLDANRVLEKCCKADRALLTTYYLEGRTAEEIAAQTGVRPTTIRVRLLRIRRSLRAQVAAVLHSCSNWGQNRGVPAKKG